MVCPSWSLIALKPSRSRKITAMSGQRPLQLGLVDVRLAASPPRNRPERRMAEPFSSSGTAVIAASRAASNDAAMSGNVSH
jgi:hypothetical protein